MRGNHYVEVRVNNGDPLPCTLSATTEAIDVSTLSPPRVPDLGWTFVDAAGHFHAFDEDGKLPTLRERRNEHVERRRRLVRQPGTLRFEWARSVRYTTVRICDVCAEQIEPGYTFGNSHRTMPGLTTWRLVIPGAVSLAQFGERVSIVVTSNAHQYFGFAQLSGSSMRSFGGDPADSWTEFVCWPMARRRSPAVALPSDGTTALAVPG